MRPWLALLLAACAHAPTEGPCCQRQLRSYASDQPNPFGAPPSERVAASLHCPLRFDDGVSEDVWLRVHTPHDVLFDEARRTQPACDACDSQLRMRAALQLSAPEHRVELAGDAQLRQVDVDSRIEFLLQQGELTIDGVLKDDSNYVRISRGGRVIARSAARCLAD